MNEDIMKIANELIYEGQLEAGNDEIKYSKLNLPNNQIMLNF
jgi:hypothetical protein